ncbi:tetratricopeptide repeat protein [Pseudoxanthomonas wuyuanensis]
MKGRKDLRLSVIALLAWVALLAWTGTAVAAAPVAEEALYDDPDPAAQAFHPPPGGRAKFRALLAQRLQRNPRDPVALIQRAYLYLNGGYPEEARRDFEAALSASPPGSPLERRVLWSRGWAEYDLGNVAGALRDWQRAEELHGGRPYWVGYSYALAYWTIGSEEQALNWFDAAVAATPEWGSDEGFFMLTRHWRPAQRERMKVMYSTWKERRAGEQAASPETAEAIAN